MRVVLSHESIYQKQEGWFVTGQWPASWITQPDDTLTEPAVYLYRLPITVYKPRTVRIHVSAGQRYKLFLTV